MNEKYYKRKESVRYILLLLRFSVTWFYDTVNTIAIM